MDLDNRKTEQQIEEEIISAYLNQLDADTPDLWDRIEEGLDAYESVNSGHIKNIKNKEKKIPVKWITTAVSLAAVLLAAIIVIPYLTDNRKDVSDTETNKNAITNQAGKSGYDSVADSEYFQYDEAENAQENYESDSVYEDMNGGLTQVEDQVNGSGILCTLKVLYEVNEIYHCEIISINENPFDLSSGMEIDVICAQDTFSISYDTTVQVDLLSKEEDGTYAVVVR